MSATSTTNYSVAFGYQTYVQPLKKDQVDLAELLLPPTGAAGAGFMDISSPVSGYANVFEVGTDATYAMAIGGRLITNAAVASGTATLTVGGAHGLAVGDVIAVSGLPAPFAGLNGRRVVTAVTTSSPHTVAFALTGTITSAAVSAGVVAKALKLDGTDSPIKIANLTKCELGTTTGTDKVTVYDQETRGYDAVQAISKGFTLSLSWVTNFRDVGYKVLCLTEKNNVSSGLMAKILRIGPVGTDEAVYGFGMFTDISEPNEAGTIVKGGCSFQGFGFYGKRLDSADLPTS